MLKKCQTVSMQESPGTMKESEKQNLVDESVKKNRFISKTPSRKKLRMMMKILVYIRRQSRTSGHGYTRKRTKSNSKFKPDSMYNIVTQLHISLPSNREEENPQGYL